MIHRMSINAFQSLWMVGLDTKNMYSSVNGSRGSSFGVRNDIVDSMYRHLTVVCNACIVENCQDINLLRLIFLPPCLVSELSTTDASYLVTPSVPSVSRGTLYALTLFIPWLSWALLQEHLSQEGYIPNMSI